MIQKIGVDVSKWQGRMDWAKCKTAGANFALIRAGSIDNVTGALYTDFQFERNAELAPEYFSEVGFYFYMRPNWDAINQADYFTELIATKTWNQPPCLDAEFSGGLTPVAVADAYKKFLDRLTTNGISNKGLDIYTRASYWNVAVSIRAYWKNYGLHIARYVNSIDANDMPIGLTGPWSDNKFKIRDWETWKRWQYSADGNMRGFKYGAESSAIDLNLQDFIDLPVPIPPTPDPVKIKVTIPQGVIVEVIEE